MIKILRWVLLVILLAIITLGVLLYKDVIDVKNTSEKKYPVRGVDVSSHQGRIDWPTLAAEGIDFAFIKATEGSNFIDEKFDYNWEKANETSLVIGAYHFFSYDSPGKEQAKNFISKVPKREGNLPPVVDIEFYGDKDANPPAADDTRLILDDLLWELENYYGQKPIIYATEKSYWKYLRGRYGDYPLWISNYYANPKFTLHFGWTFWQYTNKGELAGYEGQQRYIDLNVYKGSMEDFKKQFKLK